MTFHVALDSRNPFHCTHYNYDVLVGAWENQDTEVLRKAMMCEGCSGVLDIIRESHKVKLDCASAAKAITSMFQGEVPKVHVWNAAFDHIFNCGCESCSETCLLLSGHGIKVSIGQAS